MPDDFNPNAQISALIEYHARRRPDDDALVFEGFGLSWAEFDRQANQVANGIIGSGVRKSEKVAILAENSLAYFVTLFAIIRAGNCAVPLSGMADAGSLKLMLADCGARMLFASERMLALAEQARAGNPLLPDERCIVFDAAADAAISGWVDYASWLQKQPRTNPGVPVDESDPFYLIYSSGTTGVPKGILHSHFSRKSYWTARIGYRFGEQTRMLISTPLYSNTTQFALLPAVAWGGAVVLMRKSDARTYLELAQRERATHTMQVPVQYRRLREIADFDSYDLSSFVWKFSTSAPLSADLKRWLITDWPGRFTEVYGMTEGGVGCMLQAHDHPDKLHTVGIPIPGMQFRIVDAQMREVPRGDAGELIGHSAYMMDGYFNKPEETAQARWIDEQGRAWQRSGDIGRMDEDGFVILLDRTKDMIISGGFNIYSADLEGVLAQHPDVRDCAVIGVPSEAWGETPLALVVKAPESTLTQLELLRWANARLGKLQRLSELEFRDELPRSTIGKLLKRELREPYWQQQGKRIA